MGKYLNVEQAAHELGVSRTTMTTYLRQGRVKGAKLANENTTDERGNRWRIPNPPELRDMPSLTVGEAAKRLGVSRVYVWQLVNQGVLKASRDEGSRWWRVSRRSLDAFARRREADRASG